MNITPKEVTLRTKWDLMKLKTFYKTNDTINWINGQSTEWEKIVTNPSFNRRLISQTYKEPKKLDIKNSNNQI